MGVVLLVRHGQASFGAADYDVLSDLGREQARVGKSLATRGITPDVVIRGGMLRHQQTTEELVGAAGWHEYGEVLVDDGFNEFDHVQLIDAHLAAKPGPDDDFKEIFEQAVTRWASGDYDADYPESFAAFEGRVVAAAERLTEVVPAKGLAVVVTSGGPIGVLTALLLAGHPAAWHRFNSRVVNSGVTKLISGRSGLSVVSFNEHIHLEHDPNLLTYR